MVRILGASFLILSLIAVVSIMVREQPRAVELSAASMPLITDLHVMARVDQLPDEEVEDQALVFCAKADH